MTRHRHATQIRGPARLRRRGVIVVLASVLLSVLFAFVAFGVDTGRIMMTQTHMQNAADAASLAASQEIMAAIQDAGEQLGEGMDIDVNSLAVDRARQVAAEVAAKNGAFVDPDQDVRFGKRVFNHDTGQWSLAWGDTPYNVVQVNVRRDNPDTSAPDGELPMAFGWAVGKSSMPIRVSGAAFIESRDMVLVLDFSSSMNDDSELKSISRLGQQRIEDNMRQIWEELGEPSIGSMVFEPKFMTLESPEPKSDEQAKVSVTFMREKVFVDSTKSLDKVKLRFSNGSTTQFTGIGDTAGYFQGSGGLSSKDVVSVWVTSGMTGSTVYDPVTLEGADPTNKRQPKIWVTYTGTSVYVESSKDLSNVVLQFSNGDTYKHDGLSGHSGTFYGTGSNEGEFITRIWVKSGSNASGDGPGYGERFVNPQDESDAMQPEEFRFDDTVENVVKSFGLDKVNYPYPRGNWEDVVNYARNDYDVNRAGYRKKYGAMVFVNYLLDGHNSYSRTPDLWKTSHYPFHAVKNGATLFTHFLDDLDFGDELGLVTYDTSSRIETRLEMDSEEINIDISSNPITYEFSLIDQIQRHKQAGHYGSTTGMGYAIDDGRKLLVGDAATGQAGHAREGSRLTMIVMTDGQANQYPNGWSLPASFRWEDWTDYDGDGDADYTTGDRAKQYAFWEATQAIDDHITLHTMSVGVYADTALMDAIAFAGGGIHINVPGGQTIAEMESELLAAFSQIAANVPPPKLVFDQGAEE